LAPAKIISWLLAVLVFAVALRVLHSVVGPLVASWRLGPKTQEDPLVTIPGWGGAFDPVGDCSIKSVETSLRVDVPGTLHDLSVERAQITAPRILREIEGDFVAEVTVAGDVSPHGDKTSTYALPYHGAGLLIWLDRDNYIRLERAAILRGKDNVFHYVNFEQRTSANMEGSFSTGTPDGTTTLRLDRRGAHVTAAYRVGDQDWVKLQKWMGVYSWDKSLKIGVAAVNTSTAPFTAEFQDLRVVKSLD
jgi:regulation of enolase protein 1 (concanavalin A-like superfamily)